MSLHFSRQKTSSLLGFERIASITHANSSATQTATSQPQRSHQLNASFYAPRKSSTSGNISSGCESSSQSPSDSTHNTFCQVQNLAKERTRLLSGFFSIQNYIFVISGTVWSSNTSFTVSTCSSYCIAEHLLTWKIYHKYYLLSVKPEQNAPGQSTYQIIPIVKRQKLMWSFLKLYSSIIRALLHLN